MPDNMTTLERPTIESIYKQGFQSILDHIVICIANTVIFFIVCFLLGITVIGLLAIPAMIGGYTESLIRAARGDKVGIGDFLGAGILFLLGVGIGLIFFIIPGIYLMVRWFFVTYLIVDKDIGVSEAFQQSGEMISNIFWEVLAVFIINAIIESIGCSIGVGAILTTPFIILVSAHYYLGLSQGETVQPDQEAQDDSNNASE
jgi:hypothetical protein